MYLLRYLRRLELQKRGGRYFIYAVGEIVLIVVGIMIALQITNLSQHQSNLELERNFLHRFQTDLQEDLKAFKEEVEEERLGLEALKEAVVLMHQENVEDDNYKFNELYDTAWVNFSPQYSTCQELESTGQLNLIREETLRLAIQKHCAYYKEMEWKFQHMFSWRKNVTHGFDSETSILKYVDWNKPLFPPEVRTELDWSFLNDARHPQFFLALELNNWNEGRKHRI